MARPAYECGDCQDTGYIGFKTPFNYPLAQCEFCECVEGRLRKERWRQKLSADNQRQINQLFATAGIPAHFRDFTLESMIERVRGDRGKVSAIDAVKQFIDTGTVLDPHSKRYKSGMVLHGPYGCGKTGLMTPALRHAVSTGKSGLWVEVYDLIISIQQGYTDGDSSAKLTAAQQADVILLDDLGDLSRDREETEDRRRIIYQLINYRHNHALPMLITTNCSPVQLSRQYGARTMERIAESCAWVQMGGRNLREETTSGAS